MSAQSARITEVDLDDLADHVRRMGRPLTLEELAEALQEIWRRRWGGR